MNKKEKVYNKLNKKGMLTRNMLCRELKMKRSIVYYYLKQLINEKRVYTYDYNNGKKGRPTVYFMTEKDYNSMLLR